MIDYKSLRDLRWELGITQKQVAECLQISQSYFSRIEKGVCPLLADDFIKIMKLYNKDVNDFIKRMA